MIPISYSVQSPWRLLVEDAWIIEFIDQVTKWWKSPLINTNFNVEEARTICQIPLCPVTSSYILIWKGSSTGEFSVRSAYHMEKEFQIMIR
jgi:hypothetical protein